MRTGQQITVVALLVLSLTAFALTRSIPRCLGTFGVIFNRWESGNGPTCLGNSLDATFSESLTGMDGYDLGVYIPPGKCKTWEDGKTFQSFRFQWGQDNLLSTNGCFGACTMKLYNTEECAGPPSIVMENAQDEEVLGQCYRVHDAQPRSVLWDCEHH